MTLDLNWQGNQKTTKQRCQWQHVLIFKVKLVSHCHCSVMWEHLEGPPRDLRFCFPKPLQMKAIILTGPARYCDKPPAGQSLDSPGDGQWPTQHQFLYVPAHRQRERCPCHSEWVTVAAPKAEGQLIWEGLFLLECLINYLFIFYTHRVLS